MEHLLVSSDIPDNCLPNSKVLLHVKKKKKMKGTARFGSCQNHMMQRYPW
jgi:hypothetical protein